MNREFTDLQKLAGVIEEEKSDNDLKFKGFLRPLSEITT